MSRGCSGSDFCFQVIGQGGATGPLQPLPLHTGQALGNRKLYSELASDCGQITLELYRRRAFRKKVCAGTVLRRAFDKAVRRKPPVVAADAGPMQIQ
jgi:hypothetical protein